MTLRRLALLCTLAFCAIGASGAASASAAPVWNLDIHHNPTNFAPGEINEYWFDVNNVGDAATTGTTTLRVDLPPGITRNAIVHENDSTVLKVIWSCPGSAGESVVICTTNDVVPRHRIARNLILRVNVSGAENVTRFATAKVEGGGATNPATAVEPTPISSAPATFGVIPETFRPDFFEADGLTTEREAGAHPDLLTVPFDFKTISEPTSADPFRRIEAESIRNLVVDLPPGFVGSTTAVAECSAAAFNVGQCPASSQVGRFDATVYPLLPGEHVAQTSTGVFNLSHPRGVISDLAFIVNENPIHIKVSLDPANRYAIRSTVSDVNETLPPYHQKLTIWGVPADHMHDSERCAAFSNAWGGKTEKECATDLERKPFISLPSQCEDDNTFRMHHYDSWQDTGDFGPEITYTLPGKMTDCDRPRFEPSVELVPTGKQANSPTGLDVHVQVAQNETPSALATPPVKRTVIALPEGMSFSPSFADGLQSCTLAQMKLGTNEPIACPDASRIGEVELSTPLVPQPLEGSMYLAAQGDNPFGSLFALYLVLHDTEERGVLVKMPGRIDVDQATGRITTTFDQLPQFPFSDMTLKFRSGPRAPLVNPPTCGEHTIGVEVASYAQPNAPIDVSNTYEVTEGPNGAPCSSSLSSRPFSPQMSAGTLNPTAGSYSPFLFRLSRDDSEQELAGVRTALPPGLTARIAGTATCPDAALASISGAPGTGRVELAGPACPAASQIGTVSAGLGAGPGPNYFDGKVYLAGPYKGAPLSLAVVAPGIAGPFDLGNVVVRAAIHVDRSTAQVTAVSDPFPTILQGVILRVRDVRLRIDRPKTTINPTSCEPMSVRGEASGAAGALFGVSTPFQVADCGALSFKPKLAFRLFGGTHRGAFPKLRATLTMPPGGANIARATVTLPPSEFLEQGHIGTVCTRVQYAADECPQRSVYGSAIAKTPLFEEPLRGPVYLRSSDNLLPDMVAKLKGPDSKPVQIDLVGRIDSFKRRIRNTFDIVPDAPVESFTLELLGGKKSLLVNSTDICKGVHRANARFTAHNGERVVLRPKLQTSCKKRRGARR